MPVVRALTEWKTRTGRLRTIRLYRSYKNMIGRCRGWNYDGSGWRRWQGMQCEFFTFAEYRMWALRAGYSLKNNSLDRIDPSRGYVRDNLRFITRGENSARTHTGRPIT